jgi:hypothetical protein
MARRKSSDHPTKNVVIKQAAVDVLMVPLVEWLNSFEEVHTLFSCQGEPGDEPGDDPPPEHRPYVMFTCTSALVLMRILEQFWYAATVDVSYCPEYPVLRYAARFGSQQTLAAVSGRVKGLPRQRA